MTTEREKFLLCACCPSPCRRAIPANLRDQVESETPSALSMIALAVIDGELDFDPAVQAVLSRTDQARYCRPVCTYELDIASAVEKLVAEHGGKQ